MKNELHVPKYEIDENKVIKEQEETMKDKEEAIKLMKEAIESLKQQNKEITRKSITDFLVDQDYRNIKYRTWISILSTSKMFPEIEEENIEEER